MTSNGLGGQPPTFSPLALYTLSNAARGPARTLQIDPASGPDIRLFVGTLPPGAAPLAFRVAPAHGDPSFWALCAVVSTGGGGGQSLCLDVFGNDKATPHLAAPGSVSGQLWTVAGWGDGSWKLTNTYSGPDLKLDSKGEGGNGTMTKGEALGQHWSFTPLAGRQENGNGSGGPAAGTGALGGGGGNGTASGGNGTLGGGSNGTAVFAGPTVRVPIVPLRRDSQPFPDRTSCTHADTTLAGHRHRPHVLITKHLRALRPHRHHHPPLHATRPDQPAGQHRDGRAVRGRTAIGGGRHVGAVGAAGAAVGRGGAGVSAGRGAGVGEYAVEGATARAMWERYRGPTGTVRRWACRDARVARRVGAEPVCPWRAWRMRCTETAAPEHGDPAARATALRRTDGVRTLDMGVGIMPVARIEIQKVKPRPCASF